MSSRSLAPEVTADGLTRVAAVVAAMVEASRAEGIPADTQGSLNDLIAKAAQVVEHHASATRAMRKRGQVQQGKARESLRAAARGTAVGKTHTLDLVR